MSSATSTDKSASDATPQPKYVGVIESEWFEHITGLDERKFVEPAVLKASFKQDAAGALKIINQDTKESFDCGVYSERSVDSLVSKLIASMKDIASPADASKPLLEQAEAMRSSIKIPPVEFNILSAPSALHNVDVAFLQAHPDYKDAVFQVASNHNGIEAISESSYPDAPSFVTNYIYDRTQGPRASVSAGPAAIARVYAMFYDQGTSSRSAHQCHPFPSSSPPYLTHLSYVPPFPYAATRLQRRIPAPGLRPAPARPTTCRTSLST